MTIDEVIEHCNRVCDNTEKLAKARGHKLEDIESKQFWEHYKVREWLEELKELRSQKIKSIATIKFDKEDLQEILDKKIEEMEIDIEYDIQKIRSDAIDEFQKEITTYLENKIDNSYRGDAYQLGKISAYEDILKKLKDVVEMSC